MPVFLKPVTHARLGRYLGSWHRLPRQISTTMKQVGDFADLEETDVATRLQLDYQAFASSLSVAEY